jgi:hypothetical protein
VNHRAVRPQNATPPAGNPVTPPEQLTLQSPGNPAQMLHRLRVAHEAVAQTVHRGRPRYTPSQGQLFAHLAAHTNADGVALVSAADLALELAREPTHVRVDLRALVAGGFVVPLERVDGVFVAATRHPRHRVGYLVPAMVAPPPGRPHVVR